MNDLDPTAEHLTRTTYNDLVAVLADAVTVCRELRSITDGQLLVRGSDVEFLARRVEFLTGGASDLMQRMDHLGALDTPETPEDTPPAPVSRLHRRKGAS